jgi:hypothetical protein
LATTCKVVLVSRPFSALGLEQPGNATDAPAPEPEKVVDVTPTTMKVVEPLVQPEIHVRSPTRAEDAGVRDVSVAETKPENAEQVLENPVGKLS